MRIVVFDVSCIAINNRNLIIAQPYYPAITLQAYDGRHVAQLVERV